MGSGITKGDALLPPYVTFINGTTLQLKTVVGSPVILCWNNGGAGGAAFRFQDDLSGANWVFKATTLGGFKIRDQKNLIDVMTLEQAAPINSIYVRATTGNVGIGTATAGSKLSIIGLPTSPAGLSAGDIWVDTTGGLNILKIV
jgi:hypothetical protein